MEQVFVLGGAALDILGVPRQAFRLRDSNIGTVRISVGGVGRNIAESLTQYPLRVELVTAIGSDENGRMIRANCERAGIGLTYALHADAPSATYLAMLDGEGDMLAGVNDMGIIELLSPEFFARRLDALNAAAFAVLDANLSAEALEYLSRSLTCPFLYEPVSVAKAGRIGNNIGRCYAVKPNRFEAAYLSGCSCDTLTGVARAAEWFLSQGTARVFISLAGEGVYWADETGCGHIPAERVPIVNTTGAGDAMAAAIVDGSMRGLSAAQCAANGNHRSALVCAGVRPNE